MFASRQTRLPPSRHRPDSTTMAKVPLSPQARRVRTIIVTLPIIIASSVILFKREVLGEQQRQLPRDLPSGDKKLEATLLNPSVPPSSDANLN